MFITVCVSHCFSDCTVKVFSRFEQMLVLLQVFSLQREDPTRPPVLSVRTRLDEFRASATLLSLGHADTVKAQSV